MVKVTPTTFQVANVSPGVKMLKRAGIAINSENKGINIHVRFKKNPKLILERYANSKHSPYRNRRIRIFLVNSTWRINNRRVTALILGSKDCRRPFCNAYSSAKIDSFKKDRAPIIERSMKLWPLNTV
jgi:hypothetical protein